METLVTDIGLWLLDRMSWILVAISLAAAASRWLLRMQDGHLENKKRRLDQVVDSLLDERDGRDEAKRDG